MASRAHEDGEPGRRIAALGGGEIRTVGAIVFLLLGALALQSDDDQRPGRDFRHRSCDRDQSGEPQTSRRTRFISIPSANNNTTMQPMIPEWAVAGGGPESTQLTGVREAA